MLTTDNAETQTRIEVAGRIVGEDAESYGHVPAMSLLEEATKKVGADATTLCLRDEGELLEEIEILLVENAQIADRFAPLLDDLEGQSSQLLIGGCALLGIVPARDPLHVRTERRSSGREDEVPIIRSGRTRPDAGEPHLPSLRVDGERPVGGEV